MNDKKLVKQWMLQPGNNFCAMPFVHLAIEANGDGRPCCMGQPVPSSINGNLNISNSTFGSMFTHPDRTAMVESFKNNEQYPQCSHCWEDRTEFSPRIIYSTSANANAFNFTKEVFETGKIPPPKLTWLEVKPGNRCNLKCRICGVHNSSQWASDDVKLYNLKTGNNISLKDSHTYKYMKECEWIDQSEVWENVEGLENLECIHIMGGEPFMVTEHFEFLERLSKSYDVSKIVLWYNTNGTYRITEDLRILFEKFKLVKLSISIDDIGNRFEYQRKNAVWTDTSHVITSLFDLGKSEKYSVLLDPTVSIFNVYYLNEFLDEIYKNNWVIPENHNHFVNSVVPYNIRTLKKEQKLIIKDKLLSGKYKNHSLVNSVLKFIDEDCWSEDQERRRKFLLTNLDKLRNESFKLTFPEMTEILGYE